VAKPIEVGKTYKNGYGQDVRVVAVDMKHERSVVGLVLNNGIEMVHTYLPNGRYAPTSCMKDLIPEKDIRKAYLVVWEISGLTHTVCMDEANAKQIAKNGAFVIKEVEYEM